MKIYLAYSAVGGWSIPKLGVKKTCILISYFYDTKELNNIHNDNLSSRNRDK
jgi:hypothetical protein